MATNHGSLSDLTLMEIMRNFGTEEAARAHFESVRWPNGPVCAQCGCEDQARIVRLPESKHTRPGVYKCNECRMQFSVTVGTIMEDSKLPLNKWLLAIYLMCSSKTQISALQLQRQLELGSYRTALFLCHRIRECLAPTAPTAKLEGEIEADETWMGGKTTGKGRGYVGNKTAVVSIVERGGEVRSTVVETVNGPTVNSLLRQHVAETAHLHTDESPIYDKAGQAFASHDTVNHSIKEYARQEAGRTITTNAAEGYFGNCKMSIAGTHHHVSPKHLHFYMAELDYKYSTRHVSDGMRTLSAIRQTEGKRLARKMDRAPK